MNDHPLAPSRGESPRPKGSPGLGAVALIAALAAVFGLVVAHSLLTLPVELTARGALVLGWVIAGQALAWYWLRGRERPIVAAAWRLVAAHPGLALWTAADGVGLVVVWLQRTAGWSRIAPVWETVAIYGGVRAALLALLIVGLLLRRSESTPASGSTASAAHPGLGTSAARTRRRRRHPQRALLLAAALAAPALLPLVGLRPDWQNAVAAGLLALIGLAVAAPAGPALDGWFGLALLLVWPAAALASTTLALGETGLPLTSPIALSCLLPALGLATLAAPALFTGPCDSASS